jgi:hypothetical protein
MSYRKISGMVAALLCIAATPAFSDPALQDWEFNINGTDYYPAGGATLSTVPGLVFSGNATTGVGTYTETFSPGAAGSYSFGFWVWDPASVPFYNEYGKVNGSAASGESFQIDNPEYDVAPSGNLPAGSNTILDNLASGALNNTNYIPGTTSNYLNSCGTNGGGAADSTCNGDVSMALGFVVALTSSQEAVVTWTVGTSNPGGFSVEDIHPADGNNTSQATLFLSGSAIAQGGGTSAVPEPSSWLFLAIAGAFVIWRGRRRLARR